MYSRLFFASSATEVQILDAIVAVLTGIIDVALLNAGVDKVQSFIKADINLGGWQVHDADASGDGSGTAVVLKAPYGNGFPDFKFVHLRVASNQYLFTWDETTHTGTNQTSNTATSEAVRYNLDRQFVVASSARFLFISGRYAADAWGNDDCYLVAEIKPDQLQPWLTPTSGYPAFAVIDMYACIIAGSQEAYVPRLKAPDATDWTGSDATFKIGSIGVSPDDFDNVQYFPEGADTKVLDASGNLIAGRYPFWLVAADKLGSPYGEVKEVTDVGLAPRNLFPAFEVTGNYIAIPITTNGLMLHVPYG